MLSLCCEWQRETSGNTSEKPSVTPPIVTTLVVRILLECSAWVPGVEFPSLLRCHDRSRDGTIIKQVPVPLPLPFKGWACVVNDRERQAATPQRSVLSRVLSWRCWRVGSSTWVPLSGAGLGRLPLDFTKSSVRFPDRYCGCVPLCEWNRPLFRHRSGRLFESTKSFPDHRF